MKLVFATHNKNKVTEIQQLLPDTVEILTLTDIGCHEDIPETADTIEGNALLKARYVFDKFGYPCFADDTGLEVTALNNEPGVYSARYAGEPSNSEANIEKLLKNLENQKDCSARFKTVIALVGNSGEKMFTGICEGTIIKERKGTSGFGYDPIFVPTGFDKTFAEMTLEEKGAISHRGKAVRALVERLLADGY